MTSTARRPVAVRNLHPSTRRISQERFSLATTKLSPGFADASERLCIFCDLLGLLYHVSRWRGKKASKRHQDWRVEIDKAARSVGGSHSLRKPGVHHDRCTLEVAVAQHLSSTQLVSLGRLLLFG